MPQKIQIGDKWYVSATSASLEEQPLVLKNDHTFAMFDRFGDVQVLAPAVRRRRTHRCTPGVPA